MQLASYFLGYFKIVTSWINMLDGETNVVRSGESVTYCRSHISLISRVHLQVQPKFISLLNACGIVLLVSSVIESIGLAS